MFWMAYSSSRGVTSSDSWRRLSLQLKLLLLG